MSFALEVALDTHHLCTALKQASVFHPPSLIHMFLYTQVLEVGDSAQLSDSSDDDQTYQHLYNYGPSVTSPSPQQQQQQHSTPTSSGRPPVPSSQQPRPSTSAPAAGETHTVCVCVSMFLCVLCKHIRMCAHTFVFAHTHTLILLSPHRRLRPHVWSQSA